MSSFYSSELFEFETFSLSVQPELRITHRHSVPLSGESCPGLSPAEERTRESWIHVSHPPRRKNKMKPTIWCPDWTEFRLLYVWNGNKTAFLSWPIYYLSSLQGWVAWHPSLSCTCVPGHTRGIRVWGSDGDVDGHGQAPFEEEVVYLQLHLETNSCMWARHGDVKA